MISVWYHKQPEEVNLSFLYLKKKNLFFLTCKRPMMANQAMWLAEIPNIPYFLTTALNGDVVMSVIL